jgi:TolA-binding protein
MALLRRWSLILSALVLGGGSLSAASTRGEQRTFAVAAADFQHEIWSRAESEFDQFRTSYPNSTNLAAAVLYQAEARYKLKQFTNAITLLSTNRDKAGPLADAYHYWIGEAQFQTRDFTNAAATFVSLARDYPESPLRLRAVVEATAAYARLSDWRRHDALLENPDGVFQRAAKRDTTNELVVNGWLSLENSKFQQRDFSGAAAVYELLTNQWQTLNQVQQCEGAHLFYRAKMELGDFAAALAAATNLVRIASSPTNQDWLATGWSAQGAALQQLHLLPEAIQAWENNLTNAPVKQEWEAIFNIAEQEIVQGDLTNAEETLANFLAQFPKANSADIALLTAGELQLKNFAVQPLETNELASAQTNFSLFISAFTNSPLIGKAYLDRGWCEWRAGDTTNSLADFATAVNLLKLSPPSEDLAVARFKTGDAMFALTNYVGALENYRAVLDDFTNFPAVARALGDRALYQSLRANLQLTNYEDARNELAQILEKFPASNLAPGSELLYGEGLAAATNELSARAVFQQFLAQFPDSLLRPQVEFAIARAYELEQDWPSAIAGYQGWLDHFPTNQLRPQAFYALALANSLAGNETNAFGLFTNFVAQFPTDQQLAPLAQWWLADYFFGLGGTNYVDAKRNYELVYQNFPTNGLVYPAKMMAGRAAMGWQDYNDAINNYFSKVEGDTNCPMDLRVQAAFAHGIALMQMESTATNDPLANFAQATNKFAEIVQINPTNEAAARAWGEIGDCDLQLANYDAATNAYAQVLNTNVQSDISLRSQAQIGIGIALEKKAALAAGDGQIALLRMALDNYLDVFDTSFGNNLREGETANPLWAKKAGLAAARLEESFQEWPQALNYYRDLTNAWPSLQAALENKIDTIGRDHPEAGKN